MTLPSLTQRPKKRSKTDDPEQKLCTKCSAFFIASSLKHLNSSSGLRHKTRAELRETGDACLLCAYIYFSAQRYAGDGWHDNGYLTFRNFHNLFKPPEANLPGVYGLKCFLESDVDTALFSIQTFAKPNDPLASLVRRRPLQRDMYSEAAYDAAKALMNECMHDRTPHTKCQYSRDTVLPTRVLDLGHNDQFVTLKVNDSEVHAKYLALSYCWGSPSKDAITLRKNDIQDLVNGVRINTLQQSIQDAILVTRKLGFRYLWVDALCIIQDDPKDKSQEISHMASIYKNASITIAAACSKAAILGFLSDHRQMQRDYLPDQKFTVANPGEPIGHVYLTAGAYEPEHILDTRGWALQEFMLSSRMLIFSEYEILWQCQETELRSVTGTGLEYLQPLETLPWTAFETGGETYFGHLDSEKLMIWKEFVRQYTERKLTDPRDRLRAILGVTTELEMLWQDDNIHGHWRKWFIQLLAWYKLHPDRERAHILSRAPSWSWASLDGEVRYDKALTREYAKLAVFTVTRIKIICQVLDPESMSEEQRDTIEERPDLVDLSELDVLASPDAEPQYLLLGSCTSTSGQLEGVGVFVIESKNNTFIRIGLAIYHDMSIWKDIPMQTINLDAKSAT